MHKLLNFADSIESRYTRLYMSGKLLLLSIILFMSSFAFSAQAEFTFAPPRTPEPQSKKVLDSNTSTQLSVITTLENKIKAATPPWIIDRVNLIENFRMEKVNFFHSKLLVSAPKSVNYYFYLVLEYIFNYNYILYGLVAALIFVILRLILLRLNLIS